ncbi:MAG TPA: outer-membrane lipoprotein carrier protein LolA [Caulobacteraceae bacterium]|nr:outer-membrane lipoprotein carrier protein LolA [Caulobacteraceae bacterium]
MPSLRLAAIAAALVAAAATAGARAAPALSSDDRALVSQAASYLDGFGELKGRFLQTDPRGQTTGGVLYLKRPGYARFVYDPPSNVLVVADGHTVSITDPRLRTFDRYPLGATPLALILAKHVRLDRGVEVISVSHDAEGFTLTARDAAHPHAGQVTLAFTDHPLRLAAWTMVDAQGRTTRIRLTALEATSGLPASLFVAPTYYDTRPNVPPPPQ